MPCASPVARSVRPRRARTAGGHDAARHDDRKHLLLQPAIMELAAALLPARDLACLCATSTRYRSRAATLAHAAIDAQHGLTLRAATFADMHSLDCVNQTLTRALCARQRSCLDLRKQGGRKVLRGGPGRLTPVLTRTK